MAFTTELHIAEDCSGARLRNLVRSLQRVDCLVRIEATDPTGGRPGGAGVTRLDVRVPADGYTWIVRGGFGALLASYPDVVRGHRGFDEIPERGGHAPPLPGVLHGG